MSYIKNGLEWLIFFYSVPSRPVNNRMRVWRKLTKTGALQFKGAVYILPYDEDNYEFLQWLVSEVTSLGGEAAFVRTKNIETTTDKGITELFNQQREKDYHGLERKAEELERKMNSIRKGGSIKDHKKLSEEFKKCSKEFNEINAIDFFASKTGAVLKKKLGALQIQIGGIPGVSMREQSQLIISKRIENFQNKVWVTRKKPFVDRMASAWLIRRFIDKNAIFEFIDEKDLEHLDKNRIAYDVRGGEFTHLGDMCTFEVLVKAFNIKDKQVKKIAEVVHEIDMRDDKFRNLEAKGIEEILQGIRKTTTDDKEAIEKGITVFEMLYASKI